ncbi:MAG: RNA methyltransferase [Deltaproteobacteria bacterium]|jgi:tRNA/rRNA methyltransferase|nr:RNA methyltransferase [Deltaproteobacteria bacterium]
MNIGILKNLTIVLVGSQGARNIGSVARAMANFGTSDLRLVNPQIDHLQDESRKMAVKATPVLEQAKIYNSLQDALQDCHFAYGTTRRFGKYRVDFFHPDDAAEQLLPLLDQGRVAFVFGREDQGLTTEELLQCQRLVTIPTDERLPSMNLAQSVVICLYEVAKRAKAEASRPAAGRKLADIQELEAMFIHMRETFLKAEYLDPQNPDHIMRAYRQILGRAGLDPRDVRIIRGLLSCIDRLEQERRTTDGSQ